MGGTGMTTDPGTVARQNIRLQLRVHHEPSVTSFDAGIRQNAGSLSVLTDSACARRRAPLRCILSVQNSSRKREKSMPLF
jgi:hypothetical protein